MNADGLTVRFKLWSSALSLEKQIDFYICESASVSQNTCCTGKCIKLFALQYIKPLLKGVYSKREGDPLGSKFFPFEIDPPLIYSRAIVCKCQHFLKIVVHVIINNQWNQTAHSYEIQVMVIYSRAVLVAVTSECCVNRVICKTWTEALVNSADPDQTPQNAASDQGLHCSLTW